MRRAVELSSSDAQTELARWYMHGDCGLPTNCKEAMRLVKLGAEAGNALAMNSIGSLFHAGWGVAKDHDEACRWYRQAAVMGVEAAKNNLHILARYGHPPSVAAVRELALGPP